MYLKDILNNPDDTYNKLINRIRYNQEPLTDVTNVVANLGDSYIEYEGHSYKVDDFNATVQGYTVKLFKTKTNELVVLNIVPLEYPTKATFDLIIPIENAVDTNVASGFRLKPFEDYNDEHVESKMVKKMITKGGSNLKHTEKIVGTMFREQIPVNQYEGTITVNKDVPEFHGYALLYPEPDNEKDPNAIAVLGKRKDGKPHHIGYIGRQSEIYKRKIDKVVPAELIIYGYSTVGDYEDSYQVRIDTDHLSL